MRGKLQFNCVGLLEDRITPAGAGKTFVNVVRKPALKDHPRRCGENSCVNGYFSLAIGSPPQVRGKQGVDKWELARMRITPAGAGKTETNIQKTDAE